jgi:hypothetical protein
MFCKQDEAIVDLVAQQKENVKNVKMVERKLKSLRLQFHVLIGQLLHLKKGVEGLCTHLHPMRVMKRL